MVVLLKGSPIPSVELCQSEHQVLGHLPDQGPSPRLLSLGRRPALESISVIPFKVDVLGDHKCCRNVLVPFPRSVPPHNPVSALYAKFIQPHGLVIDLTCTVNCAIANHVQLIEFTTRGKSGCRNISWVINGIRMHLSSMSSLKAKGLNT